MDETCRLRRGEGYGVCADAVVSKCALREKREPLREKKEEAPGSPETSHSYLSLVFPAVVKDTPPVQTTQQTEPPAAFSPKSPPPE